MFKIVLEDYEIAYDTRDTVTDLYRMVADAMELRTGSVPGSPSGSATAERMLRGLAATPNPA